LCSDSGTNELEVQLLGVAKSIYGFGCQEPCLTLNDTYILSPSDPAEFTGNCTWDYDFPATVCSCDRVVAHIYQLGGTGDYYLMVNFVNLSSIFNIKIADHDDPVPSCNFTDLTSDLGNQNVPCNMTAAYVIVNTLP
jgi:hypothetical protein